MFLILANGKSSFRALSVKVAYKVSLQVCEGVMCAETRKQHTHKSIHIEITVMAN